MGDLNKNVKGYFGRREFMRILDQAIETITRTNAEPGDVIIPFKYCKISDGICPTLTTRPDGFKTMILIVEEVDL